MTHVQSQLSNKIVLVEYIVTANGFTNRNLTLVKNLYYITSYNIIQAKFLIFTNSNICTVSCPHLTYYYIYEYNNILNVFNYLTLKYSSRFTLLGVTV